MSTAIYYQLSLLSMTMKNLQYLIFIALTIFMISGCGQLSAPKDTLTGLWNFRGNGGDEHQMEEGAYLNLREDKSYTFYQPYYFDYGHWSFKDNKIQLVSERSHIIYKKEWTLEVVDREHNVLKISYPFADEWLKLAELSGADLPERISYPVHKNIFLDRNDVQFSTNKDPFSMEHSQWRIRPDHKETCRELQQRLLGMTQHLCLLFDRYNKADVTNVSWQHSPNPFILGSNGIALQDREHINAAWINTFYNEENAAEAYDLLSSLFKEDIDVPLHFKKYPEMWVRLLQQMDSIGRQKSLCNDSGAHIKEKE